MRGSREQAIGDLEASEIRVLVGDDGKEQQDPPPPDRRDRFGPD